MSRKLFNQVQTINGRTVVLKTDVNYHPCILSLYLSLKITMKTGLYKFISYTKRHVI